MKISNLFAAAFFAVGLFFSASSNAAEIYYYNEPYVAQPTYMPPQTLVATNLSPNSQYQFYIEEYGTLAAYTKVVYTLTSSLEFDKLSDDSNLDFGGYFGGADTAMYLYKDTSLDSPVTLGGLPVMVMASFDNATSSLVTKVSVTNDGGDDQDFDVYFSGFFSALENAVFRGMENPTFNGMHLTLTAETSAVPLPGALLMFASGMAFLGGVAKRKRTRV